MSTEIFLDKDFVLRGEWHAEVVDADGAILFGRTYNTTARFEADQDTLDEVHGNRVQVVKTVSTGERLMIDIGFRELLNEVLQSLFMAEGEAPTITTRETLERVVVRGRLLKGTAAFQHDDIYGIPQAHSSTYFPAGGTPSPSDSGAGSISDATYRVWVVPMYQDQDIKHGVAVTLANWASKTRGRQFTWGTPSASASVVVSGGSSAIVVTWTDNATGPKPTHYGIVVGTVNDITDSGSKLSAIVAAGVQTATITALGATAFGASPAATDLRSVYRITSGDPLTYAGLTENTDFSFDPATGKFALLTAGVSGSSNKAVEIVFWKVRDSTVENTLGGHEFGEKIVHLRLRNKQPNGTNPATRRSIGAVVDIPSVNIAGRSRELLTSGAAFHDVRTMNFMAQLDATYGYLAKIRCEADQFNSLVDYYSNSISAANA